jgi:DNA polymerase-3 subunit epsilon
LQDCKGICRGTEDASAYNTRVVSAIEELKGIEGSFVLKEKGRNADEEAFVLVHDGIYKGYGYIDQGENIDSFEDFMAFLLPQKNTKETEGILKSYLLKHPQNLLSFTH